MRYYRVRNRQHDCVLWATNCVEARRKFRQHCYPGWHRLPPGGARVVPTPTPSIEGERSHDPL